VKPADVREKAREEAKAVLDHLHHLVDDAVRFEVTDDGKRVEGRRVDVPPNIVRELRRGVIPIDGRLDLHGLGAEAARERLLEFLRTQRSRGERCVLVIHGKGEHSAPPGGVLRGEIAAWLSQGRAREHVAAFATAREDDGGEGAVYVALRR
jgi:DNA-nicking Smr family endonuclease